MLQECKHSNCAVCKHKEERDVFKYILGQRYPDFFLCEHAMYKVTNSDGGEFILASLEFVLRGKNGFFVRDVFSTKTIFLNKDNLKVVCSKEGECSVTTPYVAEYIIR